MRYIDACKGGEWHLRLWPKNGGAEGVFYVPYHCRSWRHEGACRSWCGACDYVRCLEAIQSRKHWSLLTCTYPARGGGPKYIRWLFKNAMKHWYSLRKRLERECGSFPYIQTWEITQRKIPHTHVLISNEAMADHALDLDVLREITGHKRTHWKVTFLEPACEKSGFGPVCDLSCMRSESAIAGYLVKLARELTGAGPKSQVPTNAPRHFRRLRATKNLLPPRHRNPDLAGSLVQTPLPPDPKKPIERQRD